ncbi:MAG: SDR family oxidoreductase [Myxococcota bacterium]|nr:SDR family oxidoreductase [Myxococcota bacterium]
MASPVVLITGSSSGVGLELLRLLQKKGQYRIVATARPDSCGRFAEYGIQDSENLLIQELEVSDFESHREVVERACTKWGTVNILVNNAGISYRSAIEDMSPEEEVDQMTVNYLGPINLIRLVIPLMRAQGFGRIINVSSVGGMMAMPTMGSYSASKWALEGVSEALWYELRPWNIHVSLVQPGFINSDGFTRVRIPQLLIDSPEMSVYGACYDSMAAFVHRLMVRSPSSALHVAKVILKTMGKEHPHLRVPGTWDAFFFHMLRRLLPRSLYHRILYMGLPGKTKWGNHETDT